ncbi:hypothetical protein GQ54DRAFT_318017 [Martensiomyces pterosporus]|nr:hypothetical protein GQ54DRAFT_318017 [Martensiomyces pterosporus]
MAEIPLPAGCITCYFVRHGERIDHIDDTWAATSPTPYDPPLTSDGHKQARKTGHLIRELETEAADGLPDAQEALEQTEYHILTSPFLRCVQTADELFRGFQEQHAVSAHRPIDWHLALEPGLSELMNDSYFDEQVPNTVIISRKSEIEGKLLCQDMVYNEQYTPARSLLPVYPEDFQSMMARFVSTLDYATTFHLGQVSLGTIGSAFPRDSGAGSKHRAKRRVLIFVTHGAGINSLLWATTVRPGGNDVPYCCVSRAKVVSRKSSDPLPEFGSSRIPVYTWSVDYRAYAKHLAAL